MMEELQNAIADARYMGERNSKGLDPVKDLVFPSQSEVDEFRDRIRRESPEMFTFEDVTSQPAGLYLFTKFASQKNPNAQNILELMEEVLELRTMKNARARLKKAVRIWNRFLLDKSGLDVQENSDAQDSTGPGIYNLKKRRGSAMYQSTVYGNNSGESGSGSSPEVAGPSRTDVDHNLETVRSEKDHVTSGIDGVRRTRRKSFQMVTPFRSDSMKKLSEKSIILDAKNLIGIGGKILSRIQENLQAELGKLHDPSSESLDRGSPETTEPAFDEDVPALFDELMDLCVEEFERIQSEFIQSHLFTAYLQIRILETRPVKESDFLSFRILGRGGFGEVYAQKKCNTGKLYAVKAMNKIQIKVKQAEDLCWNERNALSRASSPFVVSLKYAFQSDTHLYLVLDLMTGGDLCYHLNKQPTGRFPHGQARFHAAEILLGLEHLHSLGYVYRDLKPENVLLTDAGHCKISDLGLAVQVTDKLTGTAGTVGYMAPEMYRRNPQGEYDPDGSRKPYTKAVDWWSFGCMLVEMLVGKCPFRTSKAKAYYRTLFGTDPEGGNSTSYRYATCSMPVDYSSSVFQGEEGERVKGLCQGLLHRDPVFRLGSDENLMVELKAHPWFREIDFGLIASQSLEPPFKPDMNDLNAEDVNTIAERGATNATKVKLSESEQKEWKNNWNLVSSTAFQQEMVEYLEWREQNTYQQIRPSNASSSFCHIL